MAISENDIYQTIRGVEVEGHKIENIEAILIHEDDLREMQRQMENNGSFINNMNSFGNYNGLKICGVKIIGNRHVEPGSIFKIFKNDKPYISSRRS